jgi:hypothetical protein
MSAQEYLYQPIDSYNVNEAMIYDESYLRAHASEISTNLRTIEQDAYVFLLIHFEQGTGTGRNYDRFHHHYTAVAFVVWADGEFARTPTVQVEGEYSQLAELKSSLQSSLKLLLQRATLQ